MWHIPNTYLPLGACPSVVLVPTAPPLLVLQTPHSIFHFPLCLFTRPLHFRTVCLFACLGYAICVCGLLENGGFSKCKDLCNTCPEDPRPSVDCITLTHFIWPSSIFPYLAESALCVSPLIISSRFLLCIFSEEKMSLNPNGYKLSERTGKLTAYGEYLFE